MEHASDAGCKFPVPGNGCLIPEIVIQGIQPEIEAANIGRFLKFLAAVLLPTYNRLQVSSADMDSVVGYHLEMAHLLEGKSWDITDSAAFEFTCERVPFSLYYAGSKVIITGTQTAVSPFCISSEHG